jgi:hypothetical protein
MAVADTAAARWYRGTTVDVIADDRVTPSFGALAGRAVAWSCVNRSNDRSRLCRPAPPAWRCQAFEGGEHALTTHIGPFDTLPAADGQIFPRALALPGVRLMGVPAVEIYHAAQVDTRHRLNQTDLCLPVQRVVI